MNAISFKTKQINNFTPISNIFIEKYMPKANATFVKIYIYLYRFFYTNTQTSITSVASNLQLLESDVVNALKYWESLGLVTLEEDSKSKKYCINFINLTEALPNKSKVDEPPTISVKEHNYTPEEIGHILKYNSEIKDFLGFIEAKYAATLTPKNLKQIISMFDSLDLNLDIYKFLVTYAHGKEINNINAMLAYIEKIAVSLCEKNIKSLDDAERHLIKSTKPISNEAAATKTNKFMNFDQPDWDFEEIKKQEEEFLDEYMKRLGKKND